tara:strand:+ start:414 stop:719 length:306 start_codon:yes stop_codon:yes gene_type:complete
MYDYVNLSSFNSWFATSDQYKNNFSYEGRKALFNYLEQLEEDTGQTIEFDPIALCCEYSEYENIQEFWQDYSEEDYPTIEKIQDNTSVIEFGKNSFIIQQF